MDGVSDHPSHQTERKEDGDRNQRGEPTTPQQERKNGDQHDHKVQE